MDWKFLTFVGVIFVIGAVIGVYTGELTPQPGFSLAGNVAGASCALYQCPFEITEAGKGGNYTYQVGSRFNVIFNNGGDASVLRCLPEGVAGRIMDTPPGSNTATFEGVTPGTCTVSKGDFTITVNIVE